jgi:hypothetical protein
MKDYVEIALLRNRGWPWPDDSWGLTPMFGGDGWCRACGVPQHEQTGSVVLRRAGMATVVGGWVPYWRYDVYCLERSLAVGAAELFGVDLRPVQWPRTPAGEAEQIVIPTSADSWFDESDLAERVSQVHGEASETCEDCGMTRWLPVMMVDLPMPPSAIFAGQPAVVASPEWFGAGARSFSQILWRRDLADFLVAASPKDFGIRAIGRPDLYDEKSVDGSAHGG